MKIPGMVMLTCGIVGLLAAIIWILVDLIRKDKREAKLVKKAALNTSKHPIKKLSNPAVSSQMTEGLSGAVVLNKTESQDKTEGLDATVGLDETEGIGITQALDETQALGETQALDETEGLNRIEGLDATVGLDETEGIGITQALDETVSIEATAALSESSDLTERFTENETVERRSKFCGNCGTPLTGKGRFCIKCGFKNS